MTFLRNLVLSGIAACALAVPGKTQDLSNVQSEFVDNLPPQVWVGTVEKTERGHRIGNPDADVQLAEFISYTCSHCADFAKQSDGTLDLAAVGPGHIAIEVRPVIRNWLDMVVTMLVQCGDAKGFKDRHRMFLYAQDDWLGKAIAAPKGQKELWARDTATTRLSVARALDFDDMLIARGMSAPQVNSCLKDDALANQIRANDRADRTDFKIAGTPTFALNGSTLKDVHDWPSLAAVLQARFSPSATSGSNSRTGAESAPK